MPAEDALSRLTRYESLFELSSEINAATEIERVGEVMASRLKYVADIFSWRYLSINDERIGASNGSKNTIIIDGSRGKASVSIVSPDHLSSVESKLWTARKISFLTGDTLAEAQAGLPEPFKKDDIVQIFVHPHFRGGELQGLSLFSRRRQALNDLDIKFVTLAAQFFHEKISMLWEQRKLRELEQAYLQQEIMMRQNEKLAALGKLSAGIAHELNNPGAAVRSGAEQLEHAFARFLEHNHHLSERGVFAAHSETLHQVEARFDDPALRSLTLSAMERSDREYELETLLDEWGIENAWEIAPPLVKLDYRADMLETLRDTFGTDDFTLFLAWMCEVCDVHSLIREVHAGSKRIGDIVSAIKSYTYMDQAPLQAVDLHDGLNNTLVMLQNRLNTGIMVTLDFAENLPRIQAYGSELNQVWTNIIDNAIDALDKNGEITIRTRADDNSVTVTIEDNGRGIPAEVLPTIFDPFMTTKPVGEGTGLGLTISHNIVVQKHKGTLTCTSQPGKTVFTICLPLNFEALAQED